MYFCQLKVGRVLLNPLKTTYDFTDFSKLNWVMISTFNYTIGSDLSSAVCVAFHCVYG